MNNKGFAITTILYGTFLLFLMLLLAMLGILSRYKDNLAILIDENNGARDIVDIYAAGTYIMKADERYYYKTNDGVAIIGIVMGALGDAGAGPLLVSTDPDAVAYSTDCVTSDCKTKCSFDSTKNKTYCGYGGFITCGGKKYYYSSSKLWYVGATSVSYNRKNEILEKFGGFNSDSIDDKAAELVKNKLGLTCY